MPKVSVIVPVYNAEKYSVALTNYKSVSSNIWCRLLSMAKKITVRRQRKDTEHAFMCLHT